MDVSWVSFWALPAPEESTLAQIMLFLYGSLHPMIGQWSRGYTGSDTFPTLGNLWRATLSLEIPRSWGFCYDCIAAQLLPLPNPNSLTPPQVVFLINFLTHISVSESVFQGTQPMANNEDGDGAGMCGCLCGAIEWIESGDPLEMWGGKGGRVKQKEQNTHTHTHKIYTLNLCIHTHTLFLYM